MQTNMNLESEQNPQRIFWKANSLIFSETSAQTWWKLKQIWNGKGDKYKSCTLHHVEAATFLQNKYGWFMQTNMKRERGQIQIVHTSSCRGGTFCSFLPPLLPLLRECTQCWRHLRHCKHHYCHYYQRLKWKNKKGKIINVLHTHKLWGPMQLWEQWSHKYVW